MFVKVTEIWHLVTDSKTLFSCVGRVVVSEEGAWMGPRGFTAATLGQTADECAVNSNAGSQKDPADAWFALQRMASCLTLVPSSLLFTWEILKAQRTWWSRAEETASWGL